MSQGMQQPLNFHIYKIYNYQLKGKWPAKKTLCKFLTKVQYPQYIKNIFKSVWKKEKSKRKKLKEKTETKKHTQKMDIQTANNLVEIIFGPYQY